MGSEALLARTVPANLRWNQLIIGLLDLLVIFFMEDWVAEGCLCWAVVEVGLVVGRFEGEGIFGLASWFAVPRRCFGD